MPGASRIIVIIKFLEDIKGLMNWPHPEVVNGFIEIAREDGGWVYLAPDDVLKMEYVPE